MAKSDKPADETNTGPEVLDDGAGTETPEADAKPPKAEKKAKSAKAKKPDADDEADEELPAGFKAPAGGARICSEHDRAAGTGLKRWKLRAVNYDRPLPRYALAADRATAEALYLKAEGLDALPKGSEAVKLVVTELPD